MSCTCWMIGSAVANLCVSRCPKGYGLSEFLLPFGSIRKPSSKRFEYCIQMYIIQASALKPSFRSWNFNAHLLSPKESPCVSLLVIATKVLYRSDQTVLRKGRTQIRLQNKAAQTQKARKGRIRFRKGTSQRYFDRQPVRCGPAATDL